VAAIWPKGECSVNGGGRPDRPRTRARPRRLGIDVRTRRPPGKGRRPSARSAPTAS